VTAFVVWRYRAFIDFDLIVRVVLPRQVLRERHPRDGGFCREPCLELLDRRQVAGLERTEARVRSRRRCEALHLETDREIPVDRKW
jgi:hypothetical protein